MGLLSGVTKTLFGGSDSKSDPASVYGEQTPFLKDLYSRGQEASYGNQGQRFGQQFQQPAFNAFNNLSTGGNMIPGLQPGLQNFGNEQDQYLGGAIDAGINDINRNFQQNIMPQINQGAALSGTSGGSRQGIAQGIAGGEANRNVSDFVSRMRSGNFGTVMNNRLGASGQLVNLNNQANQAMGTALQGAPNLANMGFDNQYGNLQGYKDIIGSPTTLGGGSTTSTTNPMFAPIKLQK